MDMYILLFCFQRHLHNIPVVLLLKFHFCMYREGLSAISMSHLGSEIASISTLYKYFAPKIYVFAADEVWKTSNIDFMSKRLK